MVRTFNGQPLSQFARNLALAGKEKTAWQWILQSQIHLNLSLIMKSRTAYIVDDHSIIFLRLVVIII